MTKTTFPIDNKGIIVVKRFVSKKSFVIFKKYILYILYCYVFYV